MKIILIILFVFSTFISGCAYTRLTSIKSPDHGSFNRILVYAQYSDIELRENYETALTVELTEKYVHAWRSMDIFSPLRDYSDSAIKAIINKDNFDAILVITPNGTSTTTRTDVSENWFGGVSANSYKDLSGIYTVITLTLPNTNEKIYQASTSTSLGEYTSTLTARISLAQQIASDLEDNGYLRHPRKSP